MELSFRATSGFGNATHNPVESWMTLINKRRTLDCGFELRRDGYVPNKVNNTDYGRPGKAPRPQYRSP